MVDSQQNQFSANLGQLPLNQISSSFTGTGAESDLLSQLINSRVISHAEANWANIAALNTHKSVGQVLLENNKIDEVTLYKFKAKVGGYKFVDISNLDIPINVLNQISKDVAEKHTAVPFGEANGKIQIAIDDPGDLQKVKFLQVVVGKPLELFMAVPSHLKSVIDRQYGGQISSQVQEALEDVTDIVDIGGGSMSAEDVSKNIDSAPVSRIVNMILEYAVKFEASDVHIEPRDNKVGIRFRVSGVLIEKLTLPRKLSSSVVARIKILSNLKIDEHRLPQDGRFQIKFGNKFFDIRVSVMPSIYGEKVVMRLLEQGGGQMRLEDTGLRGFALQAFKKSLTRTEGIILVTGPTGSGKTQTLASSLKVLNKPSVNIQTLEDPVEIRVEGITQVQVKPDIGLTFAAGLRSFLRQDPDIIMVGEVRDGETATLAVQAALTGHLVLTTLHTNSAAGAIPRLLDMEVESFLLSSTIQCVLAQRLTRKVCIHCKETYEASQSEVEQLHKVLDGLKGFDLYAYPPRQDSNGNYMQTQRNKKVILFKGKGCHQCNGTGYSGRIGIFEVLRMTEKIGQLIMQHRSAYEINKQAVQDGMILMVQDGYLKALEGMTTLEEVMRVVG